MTASMSKKEPAVVLEKLAVQVVRSAWEYQAGRAAVLEIVPFTAAPGGFLVVCSVAPKAVWGPTALEALRLSASWAIWLTPRDRCGADRMVDETVIALEELGLALEPRAYFAQDL